jgi:hypothetical protein
MTTRSRCSEPETPVCEERRQQERIMILSSGRMTRLLNMDGISKGALDGLGSLLFFFFFFFSDLIWEGV